MFAVIFCKDKILSAQRTSCIQGTRKVEDEEFFGTRSNLTTSGFLVELFVFRFSGKYTILTQPLFYFIFNHLSLID